MPRRRFFVLRENIRNGTAELPPEELHHLRQVLRLRVGDEVEIFDGHGNGYSGKIEGGRTKTCIGSLQCLPSTLEAPIELVLALALAKASQFEWILQKATELGVWEFRPLLTHFCDVRIAESKLEARLERWQRIVREAAKQCGRFAVPGVCRPQRFVDFLPAADCSSEARFIFYEKAAQVWKAEPSRSRRLLLCVGPEGGWDREEIDAAARAQFRAFSLGPRILRAETAALAALTIVQFCHGNLGRIDD